MKEKKKRLYVRKECLYDYLSLFVEVMFYTAKENIELAKIKTCLLGET